MLPLTALFIMSALIGLTKGQQNTCVVPSPLQDQSVFTMRSSLLQVFTSLTIPCNGTVVSWSFVPRVAQISDMYLAVFRPVKPSVPFFSMVGYTKVINYTAPTVNRWVKYPARTPFDVRKGDVLAIFYDNWQVLDSGAAIPVTEPPLGGQTYVDTQDFKSINKVLTAPTGDRVIDMSQATKTIRLAAVQAEVQSNAAAIITTTTTKMLPRETETVTPRTTTTKPRPTKLTTTVPLTEAPFDYNEYTEPAIVQSTEPPKTLAPPQAAEPSFTTTPAYMRCLQRVQAMDTCTVMYYEEKWFFRPETNSCQLIWWFPYCMLDNGNLFQTRDECELICSRYLG